jgi:hypothetical protein
LDWQLEDEELQELHCAGVVGSTYDPQVLEEAPASQPDEPAPVPFPAPVPEPAGGGPTGVPHALLFGTHTLTCSPEKLVSCEHVLPDEHSSPLGHAAAQNVSPWNCAQTSPPQLLAVVQGVHWPPPPFPPAPLPLPSAPPPPFVVVGGDVREDEVSPDEAQPAKPAAAEPIRPNKPATETPTDTTWDARMVDLRDKRPPIELATRALQKIPLRRQVPCWSGTHARL